MRRILKYPALSNSLASTDRTCAAQRLQFLHCCAIPGWPSTMGGQTPATTLTYEPERLPPNGALIAEPTVWALVPLLEQTSGHVRSHTIAVGNVRRTRKEAMANTHLPVTEYSEESSALGLHPSPPSSPSPPLVTTMRAISFSFANDSNPSGSTTSSIMPITHSWLREAPRATKQNTTS